MTEVYVGIDGGGTHATAVAVDGAGRELARVQSDDPRLRPGEPSVRASALADLADRALLAAGSAPPAVVLCCALAGVGREADRRAVAAALIREGVALRIRVHTDAEAAFQDAFGDAAGILLIAGTGSIGWARRPDGCVDRVGGWGERLGDEGSGYAVGLAALRAAVRAHDGRGPGTALLEIVLEHAGVSDCDELIPWAGAAGKAGIAGLAPRVVEAAAAGDEVALTIIEDAAAELALHVRTLHDRGAPWPERPVLALAGGLLVPGRPLRDAVLAAVRRMEVAVTPLDRAVDPARGAAALARGA